MNAPVARAERAGLSIEPDAQDMASPLELDGTEVRGGLLLRWWLAAASSWR